MVPPMVLLVVEDMAEMSSALPVQQKSSVVVAVAVALWVAVAITASAAEKTAIGPVPAQWTEVLVAVSQEWAPQM